MMKRYSTCLRKFALFAFVLLAAPSVFAQGKVYLGTVGHKETATNKIQTAICGYMNRSATSGANKTTCTLAVAYTNRGFYADLMTGNFAVGIISLESLEKRILENQDGSLRVSEIRGVAYLNTLVLISMSQTSNQIVADTLKAIFDNWAEFKNLDPESARSSPVDLARSNTTMIPTLHEGAREFYRDKFPTNTPRTNTAVQVDDPKVLGRGSQPN
jgi:hypothetical protein